VRPPLLSACAVLTLAACAPAGVGEDGDPGNGVTDADAVVATAGAHASSCTGPAYRVEYPAGWATNEPGSLPACSWFGPGEVVLVPEASDVRTAPVTFAVVPAGVGALDVPLPDEVGRETLAVDGRPAVRVRQVATVGLYPPGTRITTYAVDLGEGRTLVADALELPGSDHTADVAVLDGMVRSLQLDGAGRT
jgi:hypothetical protein